MASKNNGEDIFQEFYIAVKSDEKKNDYIVYTSEPFKLSEIDIINLIKICILEARSKMIGRKLLAIYEDSTNERKELTKKRLESIGIIQDEKKPITTIRKNPTIK